MQVLLCPAMDHLYRISRPLTSLTFTPPTADSRCAQNRILYNFTPYRLLRPEEIDPMKYTAAVFLCSILVSALSTQPGGPDEPVRVVSEGINLDVHDGRLRPAIGVENIQVMRANRTRPEMADGYGWTYNHAPMLAYWNGKFYLEYLSNPFGEHLPPGQTLVATSSDGRNWDIPKQVFPIAERNESNTTTFPFCTRKTKAFSMPATRCSPTS